MDEDEYMSEQFREDSTDEEDFGYYSSDSEHEEMYQTLEEQIYDEFEETSIDLNNGNYATCPNGYCIGMYVRMCYNKKIELVLSNRTTARIFYKYDFFMIHRYLINWAIVPPLYNEPNRNNVEILKIILIDDCSTVIIKTFWLKIVQRTWRNLLKKRALIWKKRASMGSLRYREINGQWPTSLISLPCLRGCLSGYKLLERAQI